MLSYLLMYLLAPVMPNLVTRPNQAFFPNNWGRRFELFFCHSVCQGLPIQFNTFLSFFNTSSLVNLVLPPPSISINGYLFVFLYWFIYWSMLTLQLHSIQLRWIDDFFHLQQVVYYGGLIGYLWKMTSQTLLDCMGHNFLL